MTQRHDLSDIARGALILLVVWGHLLEAKGPDSRIYFAIYTFHMPAFVMLAGMFSSARLNAHDLIVIVQKFVLPLIAFQLAYFYALSVVSPDRVTDVLTPAWLIWFLLSLITWKLILPFAVRVPYPIPLSIVVALVIGYIDSVGTALSLSRTVVFFPAFLLGHLYKDQIFQVVIKHRPALCILFVAFMCGAIGLSDHVDIRWLWAVNSYSEIPNSSPKILYRAGTIAMGLITSIAFLAVLPRRSNGLTLLGQNTMPIYVLHGFPVMLVWKANVLPNSDIAFIVATAVLAFILTFAIARAASPIITNNK
ncbi:acyltransferase family protein [Octadecabacter sp. CECT 8868]|uniref:acyltransferase family protein n=1 Tax=Octadecabacter algicola TaxID=2909342 RepID=UPI001F4563F8|nr:acyltransferase family protein [Octadecabacter algicola]MCF2903889.1 acyltransferase family protein [Octadecabacter algicola]